MSDERVYPAYRGVRVPTGDAGSGAHDTAGYNGVDSMADSSADGMNGSGNVTAGYGPTVDGGWQGQSVYQHDVLQHEAYPNDGYQQNDQQNDYRHDGYKYGGYQIGYQQNGQQYNDQHYAYQRVGYQYSSDRNGYQQHDQQNNNQYDDGRQNDAHQQDAYQQYGDQYNGYQQNDRQPVTPSDASVGMGSWSSAAQTHSPTSTETPDHEAASMVGNPDEDRVTPYVEDRHVVAMGTRDDQDVDEALNYFPEYPVVDPHYPPTLSISDESESSVDQSNAGQSNVGQSNVE
ncbi:hypothetical protein ACHAPT_008538 [Fusarium lateritium]